jgi:hypothetical protein
MEGASGSQQKPATATEGAVEVVVGAAAPTCPAGRLEVERGSGTTTVWLAPGIGTVKEVQDLDVRLSFHPTQGGPPRRGHSVVHRTKELTEFKAAAAGSAPPAGG